MELVKVLLNLNVTPNQKFDWLKFASSAMINNNKKASNYISDHEEPIVDSEFRTHKVII